MEDDVILRSMLADGLRDARYTVIEAGTGALTRQALSAVAGRAILVADRSVDAEGPNGFQIASEAMAEYPALRVIYITGTHIAIRRRALGERERALLKPFAMSQLLTSVRELGG
jgi:DNA-binding response OmpR family regulator